MYENRFIAETSRLPDVTFKLIKSIQRQNGSKKLTARRTRTGIDNAKYLRAYDKNDVD